MIHQRSANYIRGMELHMRMIPLAEARRIVETRKKYNLPLLSTICPNLKDLENRCLTLKRKRHKKY
jgi:hypothetical protein